MMVAGYILSVYTQMQEELRQVTPGSTPVKRRHASQTQVGCTRCVKCFMSVRNYSRCAPVKHNIVSCQSEASRWTPVKHNTSYRVHKLTITPVTHRLHHVYTCQMSHTQAVLDLHMSNVTPVTHRLYQVHTCQIRHTQAVPGAHRSDQSRTGCTKFCTSQTWLGCTESLPVRCHNRLHL